MWNKLPEQSPRQKSLVLFSIVLPPFNMGIIVIVMIVIFFMIVMIVKIINIRIIMLFTLSAASACQVQARTQQQGLQTRAHTWS